MRKPAPVFITILMSWCCFGLYGQDVLAEKLLVSDPSDTIVYYNSMNGKSYEYFFRDGTYILVNDKWEENAFIVKKGTWLHDVGSAFIEIIVDISFSVIGSGDFIDMPMGVILYENYKIVENNSKESFPINWAECVTLNWQELGSARYELQSIDNRHYETIKNSYREIAEEHIKEKKAAYAHVKKRVDAGEPY